MGLARGKLAAFAEGVWMDSAPVRFLGLRLTATMAVLRCADEGLLLYSPLPMTPERRAAVEALGRVAHLYAPNLQHDRWIGGWAAAFPTARVHVPPGLGRKRPDLRIDRVHGAQPEPGLAGAIEEIGIAGFRLQESVLVHRAARTLVVADLLQNIGRPVDRWTRIYSRTMGFYDCIALSRFIRWTCFSDRKAARRSLDGLLAQPFDRLIVGHGAPLAAGGQQALAAAYAWLGR